MEIWKEIEKITKRGNRFSYLVSNKGRIKTKKQWIERPNGNGGFWIKEKELSYQKDECGYVRCSAGKVHRLVAEAFLKNEKNKPTVNHINAIKDDNRLENLEWATRKEQSQHYISLGIRCHKVKINGIVFNSKKDAADYIGCSPNAVSYAVREKRKCKGYAVQAWS